MELYICEWCGKEHDGTYGSGRFCSHECKQEFCKQKGTVGNPKQYITKICPRCGKEFTVSIRNKRTYCSRSCANVRIHTEQTKQKISEGVLKHIQQYGPIGSSDRCKKVNKKVNKKLYNYKTPEEYPYIDIKIHTCKICGKQFYHVYNRHTCDNPQCRKEYNRLCQLKHWKESPRDKYRTEDHWNSLAFESKYSYYYTYKIVNNVNGKYYYGMHMTNDLEDGYMGSGRAIKNAIRKHGIQNFTKTILQYFKCYADMADAETLLITDEVISDHNSYNAKCGGCGGPAFTGHKHTEETKRILREKSKAWHEKNKVK